MPLPAVAAIGAAAGKAGAAAGAAGKAGGAAAKGAAKRAGKKAGKKARRGIKRRLLAILANPLMQVLIAIPFPVAVISYQLIPSISKEIKLLRLIIALFAGGGEAAVAWPTIIIGLSFTAAGAAAGSAICSWEICTAAGAAIGGVIGVVAGGATIAGTFAFFGHLSLIGVAWLILVFKFVMKSVLPKRM